MGGSVLVEHNGAVVTVTLNRPEWHNAMTISMWQALEKVFRNLAGQREVRVVVLRGAGKSFTSGSDVREWLDMAAVDVDSSFEQMEAAISRVERLPVPVIAAVKGVSAGAGCELALACDLQVAAETARIGMPVARLGIMVSPQFARRLVDLVGPAHARDLLYTGRLLRGREAAAMGLVTHCVPDDQVDDAIARMADMITLQSPRAIQAAKRSVATCLIQPRDADMRSGSPFFVAKEDFQEGVNAFLEKRPPKFV